jgi:hypothetical protein
MIDKYYLVEDYEDCDFRGDTWNEQRVEEFNTLEGALEEFLKGSKHRGKLSLQEKIDVKELFIDEEKVECKYSYPKYISIYSIVEQFGTDKDHFSVQEVYGLDKLKQRFLKGPSHYGSKLIPAIKLNPEYLIANYYSEEDEETFEEQAIDIRDSARDSYLHHRETVGESMLDRYPAETAEAGSSPSQIIIIQDSVINKSQIGCRGTR